MTQVATKLTVTAETFMADVVDASAAVPMLVDFWAPWCAPCLQLMPVLERLADEYGGRFKLAKVNTEEERDLAQQIGIRSLPTVVLFKDRTSVDHFVGAASEAQIRAMLDKHLSKLADGPLEEAQKLKSAGAFVEARSVVQGALSLERDNVALQVELAELRMLEGDIEGARSELVRLQGLHPNEAAVRRLAALLAFSETASHYPDVKALRDRVAANPQNIELRHALAVHQALGGNVEPALQTWLDMMREHRGYKDDLARRSLLLAFELIGEADPIVAQTRRAMTRMLF